MKTTTRPTLPNDLAHAVAFARFAVEHGLGFPDLAQLILLARRATSAAVRECSTGQGAAPAQRRFEVFARSLGFGCEWNGLGPTLTRDGRDLYLPE